MHENIYLDTFQCSSGMFSADTEESPFLKYKLLKYIIQNYAAIKSDKHGGRGVANKEKWIETLKALHIELCKLF